MRVSTENRYHMRSSDMEKISVILPYYHKSDTIER